MQKNVCASPPQISFFLTSRISFAFLSLLFPSPLFCIAQFADLSAAEFKEHFLNYVPNPKANRTLAVGIEPLPEGADALVDW